MPNVIIKENDVVWNVEIICGRKTLLKRETLAHDFCKSQGKNHCQSSRWIDLPTHICCIPNIFNLGALVGLQTWKIGSQWSSKCCPSFKIPRSAELSPKNYYELMIHWPSKWIMSFPTNCYHSWVLWQFLTFRMSAVTCTGSILKLVWNPSFRNNLTCSINLIPPALGFCRNQPSRLSFQTSFGAERSWSDFRIISERQHWKLSRLLVK